MARDINPGIWDFHIVLWDGATPMTGVMRCGSSIGNDLSGADAAVSIDVNAAGCLGEFVGASYHDPVNGALPLRLVGCLNLNGVTAGSDHCDGGGDITQLSVFRSWEIIFGGPDNIRGDIPEP